jgi:acetyl-CoA carboxylase carboxyl transferase subunit beta
MAWFKRTEKGITTATEDKKDVPKGLWYKSPTGKIVDADELERNLWVSPEDGFHVKIARGIDYSIKNKVPFVMISKSGGARMMEAAYSLMQLAKTSAKLAQLAEAKIPYISLCTDPTTGGTTASYAMLGDINISEPGALIGFAGPRVVRDTTGKDLPEGFQTAEFVLEHGFLDFIAPRKELKDKINLYIDLILNQDIR